jgi:hypothetical protein
MTGTPNMSIGAGIAIAGIWIGVAIMTWADPVVGCLGLACALMATIGASFGSQSKSEETERG